MTSFRAFSSFRGALPLLAVALLGCSSESSSASGTNTNGGGGASSANGGNATAGAGTNRAGTSAGGTASGGANSAGSGPIVNGGTGGSANGGAIMGGTSAGGSAAGGTASGGKAAGGSATGGTASGGKAAGGSGGKAAGGTGGKAAGGAANGGAANGGAAGGGKGGGAGAGTANITVWIAGDSTVATTSGTPCPIGWGGQIKSFLNDHVTVTNSAVAGRSVRTWLYNVGTTMDATGECVLAMDASGNPTVQARWTAMLNGMKAGDYLFIQFGINDGDPTCDRHVGINAFKATYGVMAAAAKARGTQPIFVTPVSAISCGGSTARGTRGAYVTATQDAGTQFGVPVIDLHGLSVALYNSLAFCPLPAGNTDISATTGGAVGAFFCDDHTHFDTPGAQQIAGLIAKALRDQNLGLAAYLK